MSGRETRTPRTISGRKNHLSESVKSKNGVGTSSNPASPRKSPYHSRLRTVSRLQRANDSPTRRSGCFDVVFSIQEFAIDFG
jgi:hypothetical protein